MSQNEVNADMTQKQIITARRDAENLKDRIRRRKEELADTTRKFPSPGCQCWNDRFTCFNRMIGPQADWLGS